MTDSHLLGVPAPSWSPQVELLDTRMGYMSTLQAYIYEMGSLFNNQPHMADELPYDKMCAILARAEEYAKKWNDLRCRVHAALLESPKCEMKAKLWDQTARTVHEDLYRCLQIIREATEAM